jgi:hypothetical protein
MGNTSFVGATIPFATHKAMLHCTTTKRDEWFLGDPTTPRRANAMMDVMADLMESDTTEQRHADIAMLG